MIHVLLVVLLFRQKNMNHTGNMPDSFLLTFFAFLLEIYHKSYDVLKRSSWSLHINADKRNATNMQPKTLHFAEICQCSVQKNHLYLNFFPSSFTKSRRIFNCLSLKWDESVKSFVPVLLSLWPAAAYNRVKQNNDRKLPGVGCKNLLHFTFPTYLYGRWAIERSGWATGCKVTPALRQRRWLAAIHRAIVYRAIDQTIDRRASLSLICLEHCWLLDPGATAPMTSRAGAALSHNRRSRCGREN